jgi:predicted nucleotidyltransferase
MSRDDTAFLQHLAEVVRSTIVESNGIALIYGSYAYELARDNSDVDVLVITDRLDAAARSALISSIVSFHRVWGLPLDDEVPFDRKVAATWEDAERAIAASFLPRRDGRPYVSQVVKTEEFLRSEEIRLRLLLNAITGRCIQLLGNCEILAQLQRRARRGWFELLPQLVNLPQAWTVTEFVDKLIGHPPFDGEMFLGFKGHPIVRSYLETVFTQEARACLKSGLLTFVDGRYTHV